MATTRKVTVYPPDPGALAAKHSFVAPSGGYPLAPDGWSARPGIDMPVLRNQDRILYHSNQPPPNRPPQPFYEDRSADTLTRHRGEETISSTEVLAHVFQESRAPDPRWSPPQVSRLNNRPTSYSFVRPFDRMSARKLNGTHFSMAEAIRAYDIGGMRPVTSRRNTWRVQPPPHDMENIDLPSSDRPEASPEVYISPQAPYGRAFRL